jgi:urease accessory protein
MLKLDAPSLLCLLQLTSSSLPVGAYSYSEGLESLCQAGTIMNAQTLAHWLQMELKYGSIRIETAVMIRSYQATQAQNLEKLEFWNHWYSAIRETEELRQQSWQMGRSLLQLVQELTGPSPGLNLLLQTPCNFPVAFGLAAASWGIESDSATLGYLHSWLANLVSAGVKLIPLGQTAGQLLIVSLQPSIVAASHQISELPDQDLESCGWGLQLASMRHETLYSRLFRS